MEHLEARDADGPWLLSMLFYTTMDGNYPDYTSTHDFFQKDYLPPQSRKRIANEAKVDDSDNFYEGLPPTKKVAKTKPRVQLMPTQINRVEPLEHGTFKKKRVPLSVIHQEESERIQLPIKPSRENSVHCLSNTMQNISLNGTS